MSGTNHTYVNRNNIVLIVKIKRDPQQINDYQALFPTLFCVTHCFNVAMNSIVVSFLFVIRVYHIHNADVMETNVHIILISQ